MTRQTAEFVRPPGVPPVGSGSGVAHMLGANHRSPLVGPRVTVSLQPITAPRDVQTLPRTPRTDEGRSEDHVTQPGDLWTRCSESLREQVSETTWQLWLSGIEPVSFADGVFLLSVPNGLIRERVETRYLPMIEDTLANEVGTPVRGRLEVHHHEPDEPELEEFLGVPAQPEANRPALVPQSTTSGRESPAVQLDPKFVFETFVAASSN